MYKVYIFIKYLFKNQLTIEKEFQILNTKKIFSKYVFIQ